MALYNTHILVWFRSESLPGLDLASLYDCSFIENDDVTRAVMWKGQGRNKILDQLGPFETPALGRRLRYQEFFNVSEYRHCLRRLCTQARVIVVKTIRLAGRILNRVDHDAVFKDIRVIHLMRHPVSVAISWNKMTIARRWKGITDLNDRVKMICNRYQNSLEVLQRNIPNERLFKIRYEDLIASPTPTIQRISEFVSIRVRRERIDKLMMIQHGPKPPVISYNTTETLREDVVKACYMIIGTDYNN